MILKTKIIPYILHFKKPAGTSRGTYHNHKVWFVIISDPNNSAHWGIGECAPLDDLSCDYNENYEEQLSFFCDHLEKSGELDIDNLRPYPSILFGLETALRHYQSQSFQLWKTPFSEGQKSITINGLIWMGNEESMKEQIASKIELGYKCIKLKIGAIDFEQELKLLNAIRKNFTADQITLRVDANGAFTPDTVADKLKHLAKLDIHSIEQPIKAGQWEEMKKLASQSPIPIALDEELIGINDLDTKKELIKTIKPQYIILKPSLHGGIYGCTEWINIAESLGVNWWITSALESNIGLNAIAQWSSTFQNTLPQGLGTGSLYTNNIEMPLSLAGDQLKYNPTKRIFLNELSII